MAKYDKQRAGYFGHVTHRPDVLKVKSKADTPAQVTFTFERAMNDLMAAYAPRYIRDLRDAFGGTRKAAEAIVEYPDGADADRRKTLLRNTERQIQRYIVAEEGGGAKGGAQARGTREANRDELRGKLQKALAPILRLNRRAQIERDGVTMYITGTMQIDKEYPSTRQIRVHMPGEEWKPILDAWTAGKTKTAARRWNKAFGAVYGLPGARWSYLNELTMQPPSAE